MFDCNSFPNEIVLLHSRFDYSNATGACNNEAVVARQGLYDSEEGWYASQLNISINLTISVEDTIECSSDNGTSIQATEYYTFEMSNIDLTSCVNSIDDMAERGIYISGV